MAFGGPIDLFPIDTSAFGGPVDLIADDAPAAVSQTFTFTDSVDTEYKSVSDALSFAQSATAVHEHSGVVTQTITFTDTVTRGESVSLTDTLTFVQVIAAVAEHHFSDALTFVQVITVTANHNRNMWDSISFVDSARAYTNHIFDFLVFSDQVSHDTFESLSDTSTFTQLINTNFPESNSDSLTFSDSAVGASSKAPSDALALVDIIARVVSFHRALTDTLIFVHSIAAFKVRGDQKAGNQSTCDETYDPGLSLCTDLVLTFPYVSPTTTVTIRVPKFGNTHTTSKHTIVRQSRGKQLLIGRPTTFPTIEVLKLDHEALTESLARSFLAFAALSAGEEIGLRDQECRQWRGVIISPEVKMEQEGIGCQFTSGYEFRGVLA